MFNILSVLLLTVQGPVIYTQPVPFVPSVHVHAGPVVVHSTPTVLETFVHPVSVVQVPVVQEQVYVARPRYVTEAIVTHVVQGDTVTTYTDTYTARNRPLRRALVKCIVKKVIARRIRRNH